MRHDTCRHISKKLKTIPYLHQLISQGAAVCTDSRQPAAGSVFFALRGEQFNGNHFAIQALEAGCRLAVVDDATFAGKENCLLVDDVLSTLKKLGQYHRQQFDIPVLGITGSNGKTTTKELSHAVLSAHMHAMATAGNLNNHFGVPLTLLSLKRPVDIAIVEMGANHIGEIAQLCEIAQPTHGLITNIGKAHLEGFGSQENILAAKSELYQYVNKHKGILFVNGDNEMLSSLSAGANRVMYGSRQDFHCSGEILASIPLLSIRFQVNHSFGKAFRGMEGIIHSGLTGAYNFENIMAAVTAGLFFGVSADTIIDAIEGYKPGNNRSQLIETRHNTIIMDAYNANPTSMTAAIRNFSQFRSGPGAVMLGDMLELGNQAAYEHMQIAGMVADQSFDLNIFVGKNFSEVIEPDNNTYVFADTAQVVDWLKQNPLKGYTILIKGSRGIQMERLLSHL
jgi:UDP-N-acetylmuramoyl-tripeptide--D-alanyl-D-alanine ligase